jgi:PAS domain-containing protein
MLEALVGPPVVGSEEGEQVLDYPFRHPDGRAYEPHELPFVRAARTGAMTEDAELALLSPDGEVRHVTVSAAPIRDPQGRVISSVATFHDITERRRAEDRHRFLSEASAALAHTLDHQAALAEVTRLAIGVLGDTVGAYLLDADGRMHEAAVAYDDPRTAELNEQVRDRYGYDESAREGVARVLRTGSTVVYDTIEADLLQEVAKDEEHLALLRQLPNRSAMLIPITSGRAVIGVLTFFSAHSTRFFDTETVALAEELGRRVGTAVANARLYERERALAATLQASLLPQELPRPDWLELAARFQAGGEGLEVGGDSYDAFMADQDTMALVVGDVCGKGAEAAARTAQFRYTTRAMSGPGRDPAAVLDLVDGKVRENDSRGDRFCTAVYALVQPVEGGLLCVASSAGHPLPLVVRAGGTVEELPCAGTLLFVLDRPSHRNASTTLHPGDALVLFTDGVTEARGERGMFGTDRLRAVLENAAGGTAEDIAAAVAEAAATFSESGTADDIAVLVARCP